MTKYLHFFCTGVYVCMVKNNIVPQNNSLTPIRNQKEWCHIRYQKDNSDTNLRVPGSKFSYSYLYRYLDLKIFKKYYPDTDNIWI